MLHSVLVRVSDGRSQGLVITFRQAEGILGGRDSRYERACRKPSGRPGGGEGKSHRLNVEQVEFPSQCRGRA